METKELDFQGLNQTLVNRCRDFLPQWLPGGKFRGHEYVCGNINGGSGDSFGVNLNTGKWAEFAGNLKGGDLTSLYAAIHGVGQGEAAKQLGEWVGYDVSKPAMFTPKSSEMQQIVIGPPPAGSPGPYLMHVKFGAPSYTWCYKDHKSNPIFYIARYDAPGERKQFFPFSWRTDTQPGGWVQKGYPAPRPLYGLDLLALRPTAPVMVVEGEKACEAARVMAGNAYVVVTWPGGANGVQKADWRPLHDRQVLIWPDADEPGIAAANQLANILKPHAKEIKLLNPEGQSGGWDAADALADGWTWDKLVAWAKPRAMVYTEPEPFLQSVTVNGNAQINNYVAGEVDDPIPATSFDVWAKLGLSVTAKGQPIINIDNVERVLEGRPDLRDSVWFDDFHKKFFTAKDSKVPREWSDVDTIRLTIHLQRALGLTKVNEQMVYSAVVSHAMRRPRNEPRDWFDTLKWDGTPRIDRCLVDYFGAEDSDYHQAASRNFWLGLVARIYRPGCQLDNMLVLEGKQGIGKTKALRTIGGNWYTEVNESVTSRDFFMIFHGKILMEIAELDAFSRAETTRIKQVITACTDRYRMPYGRNAQDYPRMSTMIGTTNDESYLRDSTGSRRFWPVRCGDSIDYDKLGEDREQLFAEAIHRFKAGDPWHHMPVADTLVQQERRQQTDPWEEPISDFLQGKHEATVLEIAIERLKIDISKVDFMVSKRVAKVLVRLRWKRKTTNERGKITWISPDAPNLID